MSLLYRATCRVRVAIPCAGAWLRGLSSQATKPVSLYTETGCSPVKKSIFLLFSVSCPKTRSILSIIEPEAQPERAQEAFLATQAEKANMAYVLAIPPHGKGLGVSWRSAGPDKEKPARRKAGSSETQRVARPVHMLGNLVEHDGVPRGVCPGAIGMEKRIP